MNIVKPACALVSALLLAFAVISEPNAAKDAEVADPYSALRLHVIAESDDPVDQSAKLAVRDALLDTVRDELAKDKAATAEEAGRILLSMGPKLQSAAEAALAAFGLPQNVQLVFGRFDFPDRTYVDTFYPAGEYSALRVILGSGRGQNWWCVMFPPLCVIESEDSPAEYNEDGTLEFKSFFAELWQKVFG